MLRPLLRDRGLGPELRAAVVDADTRAALFESGARRPVAPASTAKLLTAAAVLTVRPPTYRIPTTVRAAPHGVLVLVGGGDPTLTGAPRGTAGAYPEAARITDLADQILRSHQQVRRIVVDDGLFTGPAISPAWAPEDVPSSYASAITAVMTDGGRAAPGDAVRSADPDLAAGHELAAALHEPRLPVTRGSAAAGPVVATVESAPLSVLVEQMLQESDNVIAECLARQVAIAKHDPVSFTGAAAAIRQVLGTLRVAVGKGMVDGSGLAARDRLTVATLTAVLETIITRPSLHPVLAGLPVAGWSGTLVDRYLAGRARSGAGVVRAKTGTLTGVSALAGLVHDASGRLLVFAFDADRVRSTDAADAALDRLAAGLARCGCG
jgi:D-alanyl-D-alanine carboxypeptidase/D-alanyl-D-alanine-endopeptidase (penicillin-binding protein 4)